MKKSMLFGCLVPLLLGLAAGAAAYFYWQTRATHEELLFVTGWTALAGLAFGSLLLWAVEASRQRQLMLRWAGRPFEDGAEVAVVGSIRPIGSALTAPFSGTACVAYKYEISHQVFSRVTRNSNKVVDANGLAVTPSVVASGQGDVRLFATFLLFDDFGGPHLKDEASMARARDYLSRTPRTEGPPVTDLSSAWEVMKEAFKDADGEAKWDHRSVSLKLDPSRHTLGERCIPAGAEVCALGLYSAERGGLVPGFLDKEITTTILPLHVVRSPWRVLRKTVLAVTVFVFMNAMVWVPVHLWQKDREARQDQRAFADLVRSGRAADVEAALNAGKSANAPGTFGRPVLLDAPNAETVRVLIAHGAYLNAVDEDGNTALMRAAERGEVSQVRTLIEVGVSLGAKNHAGATALDLVRRSSRSPAKAHRAEIEELLLTKSRR